LLYTIARSPLAAFFVGQIFAHLSFLIPVRRLRETDTLLAFYHPKPSYPIHILLVPKKALPNLMALSAADTPFLADLFQTIKSLVAELKLDQVGYRLVANGGAYQAVPQLHFHLIAEKLGNIERS
jgi:histidine triad (HIT) family protein